jgi:hypothetical protein
LKSAKKDISKNIYALKSFPTSKTKFDNPIRLLGAIYKPKSKENFLSLELLEKNNNYIALSLSISNSNSPIASQQSCIFALADNFTLTEEQ